jgi:hypothetical protein
VSGSGIRARSSIADCSFCAADLFLLRGVPAHIRSDQGPEFIIEAVKNWIAALGAQTAYIAISPRPPASKMVRLLHNAELLNGEIFTRPKEAQIVIEGWRQHYKGISPGIVRLDRPHHAPWV